MIMDYIITHQMDWKLAIIIVLFIDRYLNNLAENCPYIKSNRWYGLIQGMFDALVQTVRGKKDPKQ